MTTDVQRWLDDYRDAWEARDADAAARLIKGHFEHTAELVRKVLKARVL